MLTISLSCAPRGSAAMRCLESPRMFCATLRSFVLSFVLLNRAAESCVPTGTSTDTLILCRACGHELAFGTDINFVPSPLALSSRNDTSVGGRRIHVQVLKNPHGHRFEVVTFRKADVTKHWPADGDFSWFPGFSWTVATCPVCKTHLGWAFQPSDWPHTISKTTFEESKNTFVALITHRILREDFASSLLITPKSFKS